MGTTPLSSAPMLPPTPLATWATPVTSATPVTWATPTCTRQTNQQTNKQTRHRSHVVVMLSYNFDLLSRDGHSQYLRNLASLGKKYKRNKKKKKKTEKKKKKKKKKKK